MVQNKEESKLGNKVKIQISYKIRRIQACQNYKFKKRIINSKKGATMNQLNDFCSQYLPRYFKQKFRKQKKKEHFYTYTSENNVLQFTTRIFSVVDSLLTANTELNPTNFIYQYFIYEKGYFDKKNPTELTHDNEDIKQLKSAIHTYIYNMPKNFRSLYNIYLRIIYIYFDSKEKQNNNPQKQNKRKQIIDQIECYYNQFKISFSVDEDGIVPIQFMDYTIQLLLNLTPNQRFFKFILNLASNCQFPEKYIKKIKDKILQKQTNLILELTKRLNKEQTDLQNRKKLEKQINQQKDLNLLPVNGATDHSTPTKEKNPSSMLLKTHETSQKKSNITKNSQSSNWLLESLKTKLKLQNKPERTLYSRNKYVISKKIHSTKSQISLGQSNLNSEEQLFIIEFQKSFSGRFLDFNQNHDCQEQYLAGATPKPKKKVKIDKTQKTCTGFFDQGKSLVTN